MESNFFFFFFANCSLKLSILTKGMVGKQRTPIAWPLFRFSFQTLLYHSRLLLLILNLFLPFNLPLLASIPFSFLISLSLQHPCVPFHQTILWHPNSVLTEKPQFQLTSAFAMTTMVCVLHKKTPILAHSYRLWCRWRCVSCTRKPLCQSTPATNTKLMVCGTYWGLFCNLILRFKKLLILDYLVTLFQVIFGWHYKLLHLPFKI